MIIIPQFRWFGDFEEQDTLQTVTSRGNTTPTPINITDNSGNHRRNLNYNVDELYAGNYKVKNRDLTIFDYNYLSCYSIYKDKNNISRTSEIYENHINSNQALRALKINQEFAEVSTNPIVIEDKRNKYLLIRNGEVRISRLCSTPTVIFKDDFTEYSLTNRWTFASLGQSGYNNIRENGGVIRLHTGQNTSSYYYITTDKESFELEKGLILETRIRIPTTQTKYIFEVGLSIDSQNLIRFKAIDNYITLDSIKDNNLISHLIKSNIGTQWHWLHLRISDISPIYYITTNEIILNGSKCHDLYKEDYTYENPNLLIKGLAKPYIKLETLDNNQKIADIDLIHICCDR